MSKVMVALPTSEMARRADFYDYFNMMDKPEGTVMSFAHGQSPAKNRNLMIEQALENDCTHILFIDDDMAVPQNLLTNLLKHDVDIVSGLYLMRNYPHQPLVFDYADETGKCHWYEVPDDKTGLIEVVGMGFGCCLINCKIFLELERPWIRLGELDPEGWCDDLGFFYRVRALNKFKMYVDLDTPVGHMAAVTIRPERNADSWHISYDTLGTSKITFPFTRNVEEKHVTRNA